MAGEEFLGVDPRSAWRRVDRPDELLEWVAEEIEPFLVEPMARASMFNEEIRNAMVSGCVPPAPPGGHDPGPLPDATRRSAFVAKYNPTEKHARPGEFFSTDPEDFAWNDPVEALASPWLSSDFSSSADIGSPAWRRFAKLVDAIEPGDLVFPQRVVAGPAAHRAYPRAPLGTLVGAWFVEHKITWPSLTGEWLQDVVCLPLAHFSSGVRIKAVQARDEAFRKVTAFHRGSYGATCLAPVDDPRDALALVRACTLPYDVLTTDDLVGMANRLAGTYTGLRPEYRDEILEAVARAQLNHWKEAISVALVTERLLTAGFGFADRRREANYGADLYAMRWPANGGRPVERMIEVKATERSSPFGVRPRPSQLNAARQSAARRDGRWWFVVVTDVLTTPKLHEYSASEFLRRWDTDAA